MDDEEQARRVNLLRQLTPRELESFKMTGEGTLDKDIAGELMIRVETVNLHHRVLARKLGIAPR